MGLQVCLVTFTAGDVTLGPTLEIFLEVRPNVALFNQIDGSLYAWIRHRVQGVEDSPSSWSPGSVWAQDEGKSD